MPKIFTLYFIRLANYQCQQLASLFLYQMNSSTAPTPRKPITVDKPLAHQLKERAIQFNSLFAQGQASFQVEQNMIYYIISSVYLKQWQELCVSHENQRLLPIPMNEDIVQPGTSKLKAGLMENADFQIVSEKIFNAVKLENQPLVPLKRKAYYEGNQKKVSIYLVTYQYILLTHEKLKDIDYKRLPSQNLNKKQVNFSPELSIEDFISQIEQNEQIIDGKLRIWKCPKTLTIEDVHRHIKSKCAPQHSPYNITGLGKLIQFDSSDKQEDKLKIKQINIEEDQYFIAEAVGKIQKWFFRSPEEERCEGCYHYKKLKIQCGCKRVSYCSEECQDKDKRYHMNRCTFAQEEQLNRKIQMTMKQSSRRGLVGLSNLGNTCFMNSCLQCLSHTLSLTHYFLNSYYESQINKENVLGTKGKLAKTYAKFIKNMWCNEQQNFSPYSLKAAVASINPMFSGYAQHDSQQFFSFLVDGIHEDLSRVPKKPYVESVESNGRKDQIVARQSWIAHTKRNQSIITDLMTGQYKSKVICPDCGKQSITFDPFTTVSLPVSQDESGYLKFFFIPRNNEQKAKKYSFSYQKADPVSWQEQVSKIINKKPEEFLLYVLTIYEDTYNCLQTQKNQVLSKIQEGKQIFALELSSHEKKIKDPMTLIIRFCKPQYYGSQFDNLWYKRPFIFDRKQLTGKLIKQKILSFLFNIYEKKKTSFFSGGISQEQYIQKMSNTRHFTLVLKYKKTISRMYSRIQTKFAKQISIEDDTCLLDILDKMKKNDYELDIRFYRENVKDYDFEKMKDHDDNTQRYYKKSKDAITTSLEQCLKDFQAKQVLEPGNQWYCSQCKQHKLATKEMFIYKAPQILILHLKRFKNKGVWRKEKNDTDVVFPENLDLTKFVTDPTPMGTYRQILKKEGHFHEPIYQVQQSHCPPIYELYAISNHYGGLGGGHYTAYAKNNENWYQFDDSRVHRISESRIKGSSAYILFYQRKNGITIK